MPEIPVVNIVVEVVVPSSEIENCSEELWGLPEVTGLEEASTESESGLFQVPEEFEILEFGSEAAKKCAKWIHAQSFRGRQSVRLRIYFASADSEEHVAERVRQWALEKPFKVEWVSVRTLVDQDYAEEYRRSVRGQNLGKNLWVGPPWERAPQERLSFIVEPGLAFGTGDHPTTQLCLEALEDLSSQGKAFEQILDLGCGTGVLALAAKRFFPQAQVTASDLDPQCEEEFQKTLKLNGGEDLFFQLYFGPAGRAESLSRHLKSVDLLISNIYAEVLVQALPSIAVLLAEGGRWIASGILEGPSEDILQNALKKQGLEVLERRTRQRVRSDFSLSHGLEEETENWVLLQIE